MANLIVPSVDSGSLAPVVPALPTPETVRAEYVAVISMIDGATRTVLFDLARLRFRVDVGRGGKVLPGSLLEAELLALHAVREQAEQMAAVHQVICDIDERVSRAVETGLRPFHDCETEAEASALDALAGMADGGL